MIIWPENYKHFSTYLLDCSPVRYKKAFNVALKSSLMCSVLLFLRNASASSTNNNNLSKQHISIYRVERVVQIDTVIRRQISTTEMLSTAFTKR